MAYAFPGEGALDYFPCNYGVSKLTFRGPKRSLERPYIAFLGGSETYGKYVPDPFPDLVEDQVGFAAINLGCVNAGPDVYLAEPEVLRIAAGAEAVVLQVLGAANLSNRFYTVHPRRNDRFIAATPELRALYREVDFTEFNFTRHMLTTLEAVSKDRFEQVAEVLRQTWAQRMGDLLAQLPGRTVLLWMGDQPPQPRDQRRGVKQDPVLVDRAMMADLVPRAGAYVEAVTSPEAKRSSLEGMAFAALEMLAAQALPGPSVHRDVANKLALALESVLRQR
jgi:Domain of unknown function (DUF6473)